MESVKCNKALKSFASVKIKNFICVQNNTKCPNLAWA